AFSFTFTGATLAWSSPAIPKFKSGEANVVITDTLLLNTTMPELMYVARFMMGLATGIIAVVRY
ncbi:hypothetical protein HF086_007443, partial [Spodoptera exigua]